MFFYEHTVTLQRESWKLYRIQNHRDNTSFFAKIQQMILRERCPIECPVPRSLKLLYVYYMDLYKLPMLPWTF